MYSVSASGIRFHISVLFPAVFLFIWYQQSASPVFMWLIAMSVHEVGHLIVLLLCRAKPSEVIVSAFGVRFCVPPSASFSYIQDALVAAAGPFVNLAISLFFYLLKDSVCSLTHFALGAVNLLPFYPLDGERVMRALLLCAFSPWAVDRILQGVFWVLWCLLAILSMRLSLPPYNNGTLLVFTFYVGFSTLLQKGN